MTNTKIKLEDLHKTKTMRIGEGDTAIYVIANEINQIKLYSRKDNLTQVIFKVNKGGCSIDNDVKFLYDMNITQFHNILKLMKLNATITLSNDITHEIPTPTTPSVKGHRTGTIYDTNMRSKDCKLRVALPIAGMPIAEHNFTEITGILGMTHNKQALKLFGIPAKILKINDIIDNYNLNRTDKIKLLCEMIEDYMKDISMKYNLTYKNNNNPPKECKVDGKTRFVDAIDAVCSYINITENSKEALHKIRKIRNKAHDNNYDHTEAEFEEVKKYIFGIMVLDE